MKTIIWSDKDAILYKKLLPLALPIAFQQFMLAAVSTLDALMLGPVSQDSLSAVSLAGQITFVFNFFIGGLVMGTSILAAQYYGREDMTSIGKILAYAIRISFLISATFFLAALFIPRTLMRIFTNELQLVLSGVVHLRVAVPSYLFTGISQIYLCILKNTSYTTKSVMIGSIAVVVDILLNAALTYRLLFSPEMEIADAALTTSISELVEMGWVYLESLRGKRARPCMKYCSATGENLVRGYWKYTMPTLDDYLVQGCGFTTYSVIAGHLGSDAMTANSIADIVKNPIVGFCTGPGNGDDIVAGNELGMGNLKQAKEYGGHLRRFAVISDVLSGVFLVAFTPIIVKVTTLSPRTIRYLRWMLIPCAYYMIGKSVNMTTIAGIFLADGDPKFGLIYDAITMWAFAVPAGFLAVSVWDLSVVIAFLIISLDKIVKLPTVTLHYRKYGWLKNLMRQKRNQNR